jgi:hypothetical protein
LGRTKIRPQLARGHLRYGEWLRRASQRVDARAPLRAAYEMFTAMGIHAFAERTRHELAQGLHELGVTSRRRLREVWPAQPG